MKSKIWLLSTILPFLAAAQIQPLLLQQAIDKAQTNDPWLHGSELQQSAKVAESVFAGSLPDPQISLALNNLPTDTFHFDQEQMTQLRLGVSQRFPRGQSRQLKQAQLQIESQQYPLLREDRKAQVAATVSGLWLDAFSAQHSLELIKETQELFQQMVDATSASYSSTTGRVRQHDVVRAQFESTQLEDRLTAEHQKLDVALASLSQWITNYNRQQFRINASSDTIKIASTLPKINVPFDVLNQATNIDSLAQHLLNHPAILAIDVAQHAAGKAIEFAEQGYKPEWSVNASYAYRNDSPTGSDRADFFSVGVTFDVPLFTSRKQDKQVSASIAKEQSIRTEKSLYLQRMLSQVQIHIRQLERLQQRRELFQRQLLTQSYEQAEAALSAYTNDDGDFSDVMRSGIAQLETKILALQLDVDILKTKAQLNYFFTQSNAHRSSNQEQF